MPQIFAFIASLWHVCCKPKEAYYFVMKAFYGSMGKKLLNIIFLVWRGGAGRDVNSAQRATSHNPRGLLTLFTTESSRRDSFA